MHNMYLTDTFCDLAAARIAIFITYLPHISVILCAPFYGAAPALNDTEHIQRRATSRASLCGTGSI